MPTRITLIYHAYKNFEVPNKIAKMIQEGTIQWRSHHDDIYYTDEDGKEQRVSSSSEFVAWEGHDDYEVEEAEESDEDDDDAKSANSSTYGEGCRRICRMCGEECSCWNYNDEHEVVCEDCEEEEDDCVIAQCCNDANGCPQCCSEGEEDDDGFEDCECGYTHHHEDKCPNEATAEHYEKWRKEEVAKDEPLVEGVDYEVINSGIVWKESACEEPCRAGQPCCYRSYKMGEKIEAHYRKSKPQ